MSNKKQFEKDSNMRTIKVTKIRNNKDPDLGLKTSPESWNLAILRINKLV